MNHFIEYFERESNLLCSLIKYIIIDRLQI